MDATLSSPDPSVEKLDQEQQENTPEELEQPKPIPPEKDTKGPKDSEEEPKKDERQLNEPSRVPDAEILSPEDMHQPERKQAEERESVPSVEGISHASKQQEMVKQIESKGTELQKSLDSKEEGQVDQDGKRDDQEQDDVVHYDSPVF